MMYCVDHSVQEPIMLITKHIGTDETEGMGVDSSIFLNELLYLDTLGKKRIQVWINSPGGDVTGGYDIYAGILKTNTPVDTYCIGMAASIAGVIFQAGRKRIMTDYAWLMYHNPFYADDTSKTNPMLATMRQSIVKMIEQKCGMSERQVSEMMNRESFITSSEALELKLCDQIDPSKDENTKYLKKITDQINFQKECNKVLNSILNPQIINNMDNTKITMRLKLNDSAPQDDIVKAIDAIESRAVKAETELSEVQNKAKSDGEKSGFEKKKLEDRIKELESGKAKDDAELEDCKNKLKAMESDKKAAEDKAEEDKAKNMIDLFAKEGRIKNEESTKLEWMTTVKAIGHDKVKNMIEALPINKSAVKITELHTAELKDGELPTTATGLAVKNRLKREGKI